MIGEKKGGNSSSNPTALRLGRLMFFHLEQRQSGSGK
jgi:hypothetical protein